MRKPNSCEANYSHIRINVFQNALCEKDESHCDPDQQDAAWGFCGFEEELKGWADQRVTSIHLAGRFSTSFTKRCIVSLYRTV